MAKKKTPKKDLPNNLPVVVKDEDGNYLGVIYPLAMRVYEDGEEFDQFEGL